jgi:[CysO sulfur-carrier protein]-S-L-cysteine hydrolase
MSPAPGQCIVLSPTTLDTIYVHAEREYPFECCGIVFGAKHLSIANSVIPCENIQDRLHAQDPIGFWRDKRRGYSLDESAATMIRRSFKSGAPAKIVYHSHVDVGAHFSAADQEAATFKGKPIYPLEYLVVDIRAKERRGAKQFTWGFEQRKYVEAATYDSTGALVGPRLAT